MRHFDTLGIGNAVTDIIAPVSDKFLASQNLPKGTMTLASQKDAEQLNHALKKQNTKQTATSGGSVANSIIGVATLGGNAAFLGRVHDDETGHEFIRSMTKAGAHFLSQPNKSPPPTAQCFSLVTPDAQRTMQTYLGASLHLTADDLPQDALRAAGIVLLEGYLWSAPHGKALRCHCAAHKKRLALTLSDTALVTQNKTAMRDYIQQHADIVFANEAEARALTDTNNAHDAAKILAEWTLAVVTRSEKGALIATDADTITIDAMRLGPVTDTTGAGDLFAAGFLFGLTNDKDMATCGALGALAAAEIISHFGARPERSLQELARQHHLL